MFSLINTDPITRWCPSHKKIALCLLELQKFQESLKNTRINYQKPKSLPKKKYTFLIQNWGKKIASFSCSTLFCWKSLNLFSNILSERGYGHRHGIHGNHGTHNKYFGRKYISITHSNRSRNGCSSQVSFCKFVP